MSTRRQRERKQEQRRAHARRKDNRRPADSELLSIQRRRARAERKGAA